MGVTERGGRHPGRTGDPRLDPEGLITVCLAYDDEVLLAGCAHHLIQAPGIRLVSSTTVGYTREHLDSLFAVGPDVLIIGIDTLEDRHLDLMIQAAAGRTGGGLLLLINELGVGAPEALATFIRSWPGGFACVFKRSVESSRGLISLVESVGAGRVIADSPILNRMLGRETKSGWLGLLSARETETLLLIVDGLSNAAIADRMHLERKTVERHINSIYSKLGVSSDSTHPRVQAVTAYLSATAERA